MTQKFAPVSVVFPGLNEETTIANCLTALLNQTVKPKQVIFVNHNSTDNTKAIAETFKPNFKKQGVEFLIITETKKGIANARNAGFSKASQPIIASTDSDCMPDKNWVKEIQKFFEKNPRAVACAGKVVHYDAAKLWKEITRTGYYGVFYKFLHFVNGFHPLTTANCAVRKSAFKQVGGFDKHIISIDGLDDLDLAARLSFAGKIKYDKTVVVESSFRRYTNFKKAVTSLYHRNKAMTKIKIKFRKKQLSSLYKSFSKRA